MNSTALSVQTPTVDMVAFRAMSTAERFDLVAQLATLRDAAIDADNWDVVKATKACMTAYSDPCALVDWNAIVGTNLATLEAAAAVVRAGWVNILPTGAPEVDTADLDTSAALVNSALLNRILELVTIGDLSKRVNGKSSPTLGTGRKPITKGGPGAAIQAAFAGHTPGTALTISEIAQAAKAAGHYPDDKASALTGRIVATLKSPSWDNSLITFTPDQADGAQGAILMRAI